MSRLLASLLVFRHGQRPPYPPPLSHSAQGPSPWSPRPFPSHTLWRMSQRDFDSQLLSPSGHLLMRQIGEYVRTSMPPDTTCATPAHLIADREPRDVQSAMAFADGFFQACPAGVRERAAFHAANGSLADMLLPIVRSLHIFVPSPRSLLFQPGSQATTSTLDVVCRSKKQRCNLGTIPSS